MWWVFRVLGVVFRFVCGCGKRAATSSAEQLLAQNQLLQAQVLLLQAQATQPQRPPVSRVSSPERESKIVNQWKRFFLKSRKLADLKGLWGYLGHFLNGYSARKQLKSR